MLEAKLQEASIFKKIIDAIKDGVSDVSFEFTPTGLSMQSIDSAHVVLTMLLMRAEGFESYRCDRNLPVGVNISSLAKIVRCAANDDAITIRADDAGESINFTFESKQGERVSDYELKLLDLDAECLGCENVDYKTTVKMPSEELQRICRDLANIGDSVEITGSKDSIKFETKGDLGNASIVVRAFSPMAVDEKKRKDEREPAGVTIHMREPVKLGVSLKFLANFTKATALAPIVTIELAEDVPILVEYTLGEMGYLRFYLAPKLGEDDQ